MRFEQKSLSFLRPFPDDVALSAEQREFLSALEKGETVSSYVLNKINSGHIPHFEGLRSFLEIMTQLKVIAKTEGFIKSTFLIEVPTAAPSAGLTMGLHDRLEFMSKQPFFRSVGHSLAQVFATHSEVQTYLPGQTICAFGSADRSMFLVYRGAVGVFLQQGSGSRSLKCTLNEGAIFGEVGFFLGKARTADIVAIEETTVIKYKYIDEIFGKLIKPEVAGKLQERFRVVDALSQASWLGGLPHEILDQLIFAGQIRHVKEYQSLCREGDFQASIYIVIQGSVAISQGTQTVAVYGPGESFGELALFFTQGKRTATAMAQRDSMVLEISAQEFYSLLANNLLLGCEFEKMAFVRLQKVKNRQKKSAG